MFVEAHPGAQERLRGGHGHDGHKPMMRCLRAADLSEEQQEQIRGVLESSKTTAEVLRLEARTDREAVREALELGASDSELGQLVRAAHDAREELEAFREETKTQVLSLLSKDQQLLFEGCASAHRGPRGRRG